MVPAVVFRIPLLPLQLLLPQTFPLLFPQMFPQFPLLPLLPQMFPLLPLLQTRKPIRAAQTAFNMAMPLKTAPLAKLTRKLPRCRLPLQAKC